jgi:soluble lytic murein transglycosylase-like protein
MSSQVIAGGIDAPDALAASQRVQQLQALVTEARQGTPTASFAAALAAASSPSQPGIPAAAPSTSPATAAPYPATSLTTGALPPAAATTQPTAGGSSGYDSLISQAAARYGLDPAILHGLIQQESGFNASSRSSAGAAGLTQLMPETAAAMGVSDPLNPAQSIEGGARYLSQLMSQFGGNTSDALAAYNAGPGAVTQYGGVPPFAETQEYVSKVLGYASAYQQSQPTPTNTGQIT